MKQILNLHDFLNVRQRQIYATMQSVENVHEMRLNETRHVHVNA